MHGNQTAFDFTETLGLQAGRRVAGRRFRETLAAPASALEIPDSPEPEPAVRSTADGRPESAAHWPVLPAETSPHPDPPHPLSRWCYLRELTGGLQRRIIAREWGSLRYSAIFSRYPAPLMPGAAPGSFSGPP